jgi:hypothetical protein
VKMAISQERERIGFHGKPKDFHFAQRAKLF